MDYILYETNHVMLALVAGIRAAGPRRVDGRIIGERSDAVFDAYVRP